MAVGWILEGPLGGRNAQQAYCSDEDFCTLLTLTGGVLMLPELILLTLGYLDSSQGRQDGFQWTLCLFCFT